MDNFFAAGNKLNGENTCGKDRICPIMNAPCPGECLFSDALRSIETGLMIGRVSTCEYLYMNPYAESVFEKFPDALDLDQVLRMPSKDDEGDLIGNVCSDIQFSRQVIQRRGEVIGLSVYPCREDLVMVFLKDISEDAQASDLAVKSGDIRTVTTIFSQLRHEIGNPLNSIKMTLQVLKENLDSFTATKVQSYIARTIGEVGRLEKLLSELREFSRGDQLDIQELDLKSIADRFAQLVENECREAGVSLGTAIEDEARFVMGNSEALLQIFHNLFNNAIEAKNSPAGNITISSCSTKKGMACIEFEDDGVGIPSHCLPMIFRPMFTTKPGGSGLGLAMIERLIGRMGGGVSVVSKPDKYTRISLTLPRGSKL